MRSFGLSMLWFWIAYAVVTAIGILHTVFNIYVLKMSPMDESSMGEGYEKTKPWHPLYNIVCFTLAGFLYVHGLDGPTLRFDVFGWVILKHPWSLTFRQFYVEYQPWITLIYIAIFLGPIIGYSITLLMR